MKLTSDAREYWKEEFTDMLETLNEEDMTYLDLAELTRLLHQEAQEQLDINKTRQNAIDELAKHLLSLDVDAWEIIENGGFKLSVGYEEEPAGEEQETFEYDHKLYKVVPETDYCDGCSYEGKGSCSGFRDSRGKDCSHDHVIYIEIAKQEEKVS